MIDNNSFGSPYDKNWTRSAIWQRQKRRANAVKFYSVIYYNPHYNRTLYSALYDLAGMQRFIQKCLDLQCTIIGVQCFREIVDPEDFGGVVVW